MAPTATATRLASPPRSPMYRAGPPRRHAEATPSNPPALRPPSAGMASAPGPPARRNGGRRGRARQPSQGPRRLSQRPAGVLRLSRPALDVTGATRRNVDPRRNVDRRRRRPGRNCTTAVLPARRQRCRHERFPPCLLAGCGLRRLYTSFWPISLKSGGENGPLASVVAVQNSSSFFP